jgi:hypothetical protein
MRLHVNAADKVPRVCWLDYFAGGTRTPDHIVAIVTDWAGIPDNYDRTTFVYDSVLHQGRGTAIKKWEEPAGVVKPRPTS